jgi:hypothetical protein
MRTVWSWLAVAIWVSLLEQATLLIPSVWTSEHETRFACLGLPDADSRKIYAIRRPGGTFDEGGVATSNMEHLTSCSVSDAAAVVGAAGSDLQAMRRPGHTIHDVEMTRKDTQGLSCQRIPDVSRLVIAGGDDLAIIRRPRDSIDRLRVTSKSMHQLAGQGIPDAGGCVSTGHDNLQAMRRPGYAMKRVCMGEREQGSTRRRIPNAGSGILACCGDKEIIGRPGDMFDTCHVACQGEQKVARLSVPPACMHILAGNSERCGGYQETRRYPT